MISDQTKCPMCKKPTDQGYKPFCSKRCADLDLGHWLSGDYVLPGHSPLEGIEDPQSMED